MKAQKGGRSEFTIRPLELKWSEWCEHYNRCSVRGVQDAKTLIKIVSDWQRETDAWVLSLSDNQKKDFCDLARDVEEISVKIEWLP